MSNFFETASTYLKNFGDKDAYDREMKKKIGERLGIQIGPEIILSMEELNEKVKKLQYSNYNKLSEYKKRSFDNLNEKLQQLTADNIQRKTEIYNILYFQLLLLKSTQSKEQQYLLSEIVYEIEQIKKNDITRKKYDDIELSKTWGGPFFYYIGGINDFMIKSNGNITRIPNNYPPKFNINTLVYACLQSGSEQSFTSYIRGYGWTKTLNKKSFCKDTDDMAETNFDQKPFAYEITKYKDEDEGNKLVERTIPIYKLLRINNYRKEISSNHFDYILVEVEPNYVQKITQKEIEESRSATNGSDDAPVDVNDIVLDVKEQGQEPITNTGGKKKKYTNKLKPRYTKKHKNNKKYKTKNLRKTRKH